MNKENLVFFTKRPNEPAFTRRDNYTLDLPANFYTDRFRPIGPAIGNRLGEETENTITLKPIADVDLTFASSVKRKGSFSLFNRNHREIAGQLIKLFMDAPDAESFLSTAAYVKDRVNPYLFQYAFAVAIHHRADTKDVNLPSIAQTFPDQFMDASVILQAREEIALVNDENRMNIEIPLHFTASDREPEQRCAYFREDIAVNIHHWYWHSTFPGDGEDRIVKKDRRGELFYYMHHQIQCRYNTDRICNSLPKVKPLDNLREAIPEGYFPKILRSSNNRAYPGRISNAFLHNIDRVDDNLVIELSDLERYRDRIYEAIDKRYVVDYVGNHIPLTEENGIDMIGNIVESSKLSPNRIVYGDLLNLGHIVIAFSHDPDNRHLEDYSVMGDVATALRDPVLYRWHAFIVNICLKYKATLPPYKFEQLNYEGVIVSDVNVRITQGRPLPNILLTYWQKSDVDLSAGLDFGPEGNVYAQFTHLQHAPFNYIIQATNLSVVPKRGTCRIFLGIRADENGTPLTFKDQRLLMIEMDKFSVFLNPGQNQIIRRSDQSSVTIPYERSFRNIGKKAKSSSGLTDEEFDFCGCGWPEHLLCPKGTPQDTAFDLFVMISNYADDTVNVEYDENEGCNDSVSFCGLRDKLYPDKRSMGYPFDRASNVRTLAEFANISTNMKLGQCFIRFTDTIIARQK